MTDPAFIRSIIALCRQMLSGDQSSIKSAEEQISAMLNHKTGNISMKIISIFQIILSPPAISDPANTSSDDELCGLKYATCDVQLWVAICLKNYIKSTFETSESYGGASEELHSLIKSMLIVLILNSNRLRISKPVSSQLENALLMISDEEFPKYMEYILLIISYCHISDVNIGMVVSTLTTRLQNEMNTKAQGNVFHANMEDSRSLSRSLDESQSTTYLSYSELLIKRLTNYINVYQMIMVYSGVLNSNSAMDISRAYFEFFDKLVESVKNLCNFSGEITFKDLEMNRFLKSISCLFPRQITLYTYVTNPLTKVFDITTNASDPLFYLDDRKLYNDVNLWQFGNNVPELGIPHYNVQIVLNQGLLLGENAINLEYYKDKILSLSLVRKLMKKYKTRLYCDDTLSELKIVLTLIDVHLLYLFKSSMVKFFEYVTLFATFNKLSILILDLLQIVTEITKIFCYVHSIDLPESFEDNSQVYFTGLTQLLHFNEQVIIQADAQGTINKMKVAICKLFRYYAERYQEVFRPYVFTCIEDVVKMCRTITQNDEDDKLCCAILDFLAAVVSTHWTSNDPNRINPLMNDAFLTDVIQNIILLNIGFRDSDLYLLDESPIEFVQRELDASSSSSRRFSSITFLKKLVMSYSNVTMILNNIAKSIGTSNDLKLKELYLQLVICINFKDNNNEFNVNQYYVDYLKNEFIQSSNQQLQQSGVLVILAIIKYVYTFKKSISDVELASLVPTLVLYLNNHHEAVRSFASEAIARVLPLLSNYRLQLKNSFLQGLECLLNRMGNSSVYNEFYIKCATKLFLYLCQDIRDSGLVMINVIINLIKNVSNNPVNPVYNHYLFESLSILLRIHLQTASSTSIDQIEDALIPTLALIIQQESHSFIPYSLQILYLLLKYTSKASVTFTQLFTHLVTIDNWKVSTANSQGFIKLLVGYFVRNSLFDNEIRLNMEKILNIFHYCLTHRKLSASSLELLNGIVRYLPIGYYDTFLKTIVTVLLTYIHNNKTGGVTNVITTISLLIVYLHIQQYSMTLVDILESIQCGISTNFIQIVYVPNAKKAVSIETKKVHAIALSKLLTTPQIQNNGEIFVTLLEFLNDLIAGVDLSIAAIKEDEVFYTELMDNLEHDVNFDVSFVKLQTVDSKNSNKLIDSTLDVQQLIKSILIPISSIINNHNKYATLVSLVSC